MSGLCLLMVGTAGGVVMALLFMLVQTEIVSEVSSEAPLESGFATTSKINTVLSLQYLVIMVLFLVFDLEVVLVITLAMAGGSGMISGMIFLLFVVGTLWLEWGWGKLVWLA